jgi:uncharacterized membrane protein YfhO
MPSSDDDDVGTSEVTIEVYEPEYVRIKVACPRTSVLVLADSYDDGWSAQVDGEKAVIQRCNYLLRGVVIAAGFHTVEFTYSEPHLGAALLGSSVGILALVALSRVRQRKRRHEVSSE